MDVRLQNWSSHTAHLKILTLENVNMWFWYDKLVAFGSNETRIVLERWSSDMTEHIRREVSRLTDGGVHPMVGQATFDHRWELSVKPHLRAVLSPSGLLTTEPRPTNSTKVKAVNVVRFGEGLVKATADIEHSPDGGRTILVGTTTETMAIQDDWVDEDMVVASKKATAILCKRLRDSGVAVPHTVEENAKINI